MQSLHSIASDKTTLNTSLTLWPGYLAVQVLESSWPPSVIPRTVLYQEASPPAPETLITRSDIRANTIVFVYLLCTVVLYTTTLSARVPIPYNIVYSIPLLSCKLSYFGLETTEVITLLLIGLQAVWYI